ncbi:Eco57I restriction-modification methylase domain-containing protein, partial [uncultured Hymenobacter sp.]|uniref:Eco57I restriction-modification methylase domain-containing protein n=1 Tax=uncultured Hymenobacter sp. TaxID=170016 RepID=UPI0035CC1EFA
MGRGRQAAFSADFRSTTPKEQSFDSSDGPAAYPPAGGQGHFTESNKGSPSFRGGNVRAARPELRCLRRRASSPDNSQRDCSGFAQRPLTPVAADAATFSAPLGRGVSCFKFLLIQASRLRVSCRLTNLSCEMLFAESPVTSVIASVVTKELLAEKPSHLAATLGEQYARWTAAAHKKTLGQFFTPARIGEYLAGWATPPAGAVVRVLDPGFGTGILSCCLLEHFAAVAPGLQRIELDAYDLDQQLRPTAQAVLDHLTAWLAARDIELVARLHLADFVLAHAAVWQFPLAAPTTYDVVIANPPYFKLGQYDPRNALAGAEQAQPNMYALFAVLAARLTRPGGELLFLVPRSFSSGPYFARFRRFALHHWRWSRFHLFHSRRAAFKKDAVLQETVLFKAVRQTGSPADVSVPVVITASAGMHDLAGATVFERSLADLIGPERQGSLLFLPTDADEYALLARFRNWTHRLADLGVGVSTGPVVAFRAAASLREEAAPDSLPLLWMDNVAPTGGRLRWPIVARTKPQHLAADAPAALLVPNRNYVLLRRVSAKDDARRLVAAPYLAADWPAPRLGLENKLNYLYARRGELSPVQAVGLAALLSSRPYDQFFRLFNGNTQVSATEARELPVPAWPSIEALGAQVQAQGWAVADELVAQLLHLPYSFYPLPANLMAEPSVPYESAAELPAKVREAQQVLLALGLPAAQQNKISAYTLLALAGLEPDDPWNAATGSSKRVSRGIRDFIAARYGQEYKENTRETFRRQVLHQLVQAGLVIYNPDEPNLP